MRQLCCRAHIKAFLSAEIFPHIKESAVSNTSKLIRNELYLTWRPKDLMRLVCWRLDSFLTHRELLPDGYDPDIDWRNFDDVHAKRWVPYFGESLKNEFGKQERTFPYVLRHIEMRPGQLVILCNQIARLAFRAKRFPRMGEFVVEAIRSAQRRLADEVLNSYSEIHPNVALIIDALRGLPMRFQGNLLDKVARKTASEWQGNYSPANFKRLVPNLASSVSNAPSTKRAGSSKRISSTRWRSVCRLATTRSASFTRCSTPNSTLIRGSS